MSQLFFYVLKVQTNLIDRLYYCVIGALPNYGITLSSDQTPINKTPTNDTAKLLFVGL